MVMTEADICREYRTAKAPGKQIQILADLNGTDRKSILEILQRNGEKLDGRLVKGNGGRQAAAPKAEEEERIATASVRTGLAMTEGEKRLSAEKGWETVSAGRNGKPRAVEGASPYKVEDTAGGVPAEGEEQGVHTHTHTRRAELRLPPPREYITVGELIEQLREIPSECRVNIGEEALAGLVYSHGTNILSGESMRVLTLV